jgi:hypothetical protein
MFTEEQQKAIDEMLEKQKLELTSSFEEQTSGLKATNAALKAEKQEAIDKAKAEAVELEQRAIDEAKAKGELEKALELEKAQHERKLSDYAEQLNSRNELILSSKTGEAVKDISSKFVKQDSLTALMAKNMVSHSFDENGNVVAEYKDTQGNTIGNNLDDWLGWAQKDPDMQNHLAGSKASGVNPNSFKPMNGEAQERFNKQSRIDDINKRLGAG